MAFMENYSSYEVGYLIMTLDAIASLEDSCIRSRLTPISRPRYPLGHLGVNNEANERYNGGWDGYVEKWERESMFETTFRMLYSTFKKLLRLVSC